MSDPFRSIAAILALNELLYRRCGMFSGFNRSSSLSFVIWLLAKARNPNMVAGLQGSFLTKAAV